MEIAFVLNLWILCYQKSHPISSFHWHFIGQNHLRNVKNVIQCLGNFYKTAGFFEIQILKQSIKFHIIFTTDRITLTIFKEVLLYYQGIEWISFLRCFLRVTYFISAIFYINFFEDIFFVRRNFLIFRFQKYVFQQPLHLRNFNPFLDAFRSWL